jgi:hypothetical protein
MIFRDRLRHGAVFSEEMCREFRTDIEGNTAAAPSLNCESIALEANFMKYGDIRQTPQSSAQIASVSLTHYPKTRSGVAGPPTAPSPRLT